MQFSTFLQGLRFLPPADIGAALQACLAPDRLQPAQDAVISGHGSTWPAFPEQEFTRFYYTIFLQDYVDALGRDIDSLEFARACLLHYTARLTLGNQMLLHLTTLDDVAVATFALTYGEPEFSSLLCVPTQLPPGEPGARYRSRHPASGVSRRYSVLRPGDFRYLAGSPAHLRARAGGRPISTLIISCAIATDAIAGTIEAFRHTLGADLFVLLIGRDEAVAAVSTQLATLVGQTRLWAQAVATDQAEACRFAHLTLPASGRLTHVGRRGHAPKAFVQTRAAQASDPAAPDGTYRYLRTREEIASWADRAEIVRPAYRHKLLPPKTLLAPARFAEQMRGNFAADVDTWWQATELDLPAATHVMFRDIRLVGCGHCFTCDGAVFDAQLNEADLPSFLAGAGVNRSDIRAEPDGSLTSRHAAATVDVVDQPAIYIGNGGLPMHAHFLLDVIGKLGFLGSLEIADRLIVLPSMVTPTQLDDIARVYDVARDWIMVYDEHRPLHFKELHILPIGKMPPWLAPEMVAYLRRGLAKARFPATLDPAACKRLFIGRGRVEGGPRRLLNEAEVRDIVLQDGFVDLEPSDYTLEEEIALFDNADEVVFIYGSACGNVVFCRPDARVLILQSDAMTEKTFGMVCGLLGMQYGYVFGSSYHRWDRGHNSDWVMDPALVAEGLHRLRQ